MKKILVFVLLLVAMLPLFADDDFYFFHSKNCPHCQEAKPFLEGLKGKYPSIKFHDMEVTEFPENLKHFQETVARLNIQGVGVPLFVIGNDYEVGFKKNSHESRLIRLLDRHIHEPKDEGIDFGTFYFFHSDGCPHCQEAKPFISELEKQYGDVTFKKLELTGNKENLALLKKLCKERNFSCTGVPTFIMGRDHVEGFTKDIHSQQLKDIIDKNLLKARGDQCAEADTGMINVPIIGKIDPKIVSLPSFTFIIGLLDGVNPCAMWVLMFLLTLLVNAKSRKKLIMIGTVFVFSSAFVYFLFMTAWLNIFTFIGIKDTVTIVLGAVAILMGLINFKEFFFFKKGVSLMIPDKAKPKLFEKMRKIMNNSNMMLSLLGTITLAFFVNLIELGCTIGLPAIYTRVLSIQEISTLTKYVYMALYNLYYVIPLAIIVGIFVVTMGKHRFEEKHAKVLKLVSGVLMLTLGAILVINPDFLVFS